MKRESGIKDFAIFLTAAIDIKGMPKAYPMDPQTREQDYIRSLNYYINNHPKVKKIIFVENSGWALDHIQKTVMLNNPHDKEVEFISLNINDFPRVYGKGYGEISLMDAGLQQSELAKSVNYVGKITGRICLLNLTQLLEKADFSSYPCMLDVKDQGWFLKKYVMQERTAAPYADTRFIIFSKEFYYQYFQPSLLNHKGGVFYMEKQIYQAIKKAESDVRVLNRFPVEPKFSGVAGHFGGKDYDSLQEKSKFIFRSFMRQRLEWLHI